MKLCYSQETSLVCSCWVQEVFKLGQCGVRISVSILQLQEQCSTGTVKIRTGNFIQVQIYIYISLYSLLNNSRNMKSCKSLKIQVPNLVGWAAYTQCHPDSTRNIDKFIPGFLNTFFKHGS